MENQSAPTLESILKQDSELILQCLDISTLILRNLTGNEVKIIDTLQDANCMMAEASIQSDNLKLLRDRLIDIKTTMLIS